MNNLEIEITTDKGEKLYLKSTYNDDSTVMDLLGSIEYIHTMLLLRLSKQAKSHKKKMKVTILELIKSENNTSKDQDITGKR